MKENKMLRKSKKELEELKIRNTDEEGWEYQKEIQEIYGIEDLQYLEEKVNELNKEREEK